MSSNFFSHMADGLTTADCFSKRGFCIFESLLTANEIDVLRAEVGRLHSALDGDVCEQQCVLDVPADGVPPEHSPARSEAAAYLRWRSRSSPCEARPVADALIGALVLEKLAVAMQAAQASSSGPAAAF